MAQMILAKPRFRFRHFQIPLCRIHAIFNDFRLCALECKSNRCRRRRFVDSGGWLNVFPNSPAAMVFLPFEALIEDDDEVKGAHGAPAKRPRILIPNCPWCGKSLRVVRGGFY
jgi:hypothetical protein